jgi:hypothetical protein
MRAPSRKLPLGAIVVALVYNHNGCTGYNPPGGRPFLRLAGGGGKSRPGALQERGGGLSLFASPSVANRTAALTRDDRLSLVRMCRTCCFTVS